MTGLLSIVWRELAVGSRQIGTQRGRLFAAGIVFLLFAVFILFQRQPQNIVGMLIFSIGSLLLFVQALVSGLRYTADAISEEKRDGTLGLLFLTELRSYEIVLGKMAVRSVRAFYSMIATLPLFTFCILFGGVQARAALGMSAVLLITMFYSLAVGIFVSSRTTEDKSAFLGTITLLIALSTVPPVAWKLLSLTGWPGFDWVLYISPFYAFHVAGGPNIAESMRAILMLGVIAFTLLALAAREVSHFARNQSAIPTQIDGTESNPSMRTISDDSQGLLEEDPFRWLLKREQLYPKIVTFFGVAGILFALVGYGLVKQYGPGLYFNIGLNTLYAIHVLWKILVASDALRRLHHDRRTGALEQLLVTPLPPDQIVQAQVNHTFRLFVPSAICLALGNFIFFQPTLLPDMVAVPLGGALFLFIDARTLCWRAVLQALKPSRFPIALLRVAGVTLLPPLLVIMLILWSGRGFSQNEGNIIFGIWFVACGIYDLILMHRAKTELQEHFRELSAQTMKAKVKNSPPLPKPIRWLLLLEPAPARNS